MEAQSEVDTGTPGRATTRARALVAACRPYQWVKNLLVFFPLLTAHRLFDRRDAIPAVLAFVAFSLTASSAYILNDVVDLPRDRLHRTKARRPFASGAVPIRWAFTAIPLLLLGAIGVSLALPAGFQAVLAFYWALTTLYTLGLKRLAIVDVLALAGLYTVRLFGGSQASHVPLSNWIIAFSMFLFLSLALVKRVAELLVAQATSRTASIGREYRVSDLAVLGRMGMSAGYSAVIVLALYLNSADVLRFYRHPDRLWLLCALLVLWLSRVWLVTERGEMHDDPTVFALRDMASYGIAAVSALVLYWAT